MVDYKKAMHAFYKHLFRACIVQTNRSNPTDPSDRIIAEEKQEFKFQ